MSAWSEAGDGFHLLYLCISCSGDRSLQEKSVEWIWAMMAKITLDRWHHLGAVSKLLCRHHGSMLSAAGRKNSLALGHIACMSFYKIYTFFSPLCVTE